MGLFDVNGFARLDRTNRVADMRSVIRRYVDEVDRLILNQAVRVIGVVLDAIPSPQGGRAMEVHIHRPAQNVASGPGEEIRNLGVGELSASDHADVTTGLVPAGGQLRRVRVSLAHVVLAPDLGEGPT